MILEQVRKNHGTDWEVTTERKEMRTKKGDRLLNRKKSYLLTKDVCM
jgi:hypothetical protein